MKHFSFFTIIFLFNLFFTNLAWSSSLQDLVSVCRTETFCDALSKATPTETPAEIADTNQCFKKKIHACYSVTARAGIWMKSNDSDLSKVILYGNYCGWRNLARNPDGSHVNWKNEAEAIKASINTPAIDQIDELCKWHDIQYFTAPYNICDADKIFIKKIQDLVWDESLPLSVESREVAMAFSGAIEKNHLTCRLIGFMKRNHIWN